jgi:hypothetical protein
MKDLVITTISDNYNWVDIKNWIISLKNTQYQGDILILAYNFENDEKKYLQKLSDLGAIILQPNNDYRGNITNNFVWHSGMVNPQNANKLIHNVRLFHVWQYFTENDLESQYNRVVFTDGRDVVFQTNPTEWLDVNMKKDILVPSEYVLYKDQPWNYNNAMVNYGPYIFEYLLKDKPVCNVGTFAVTSSICRDLCLTLYLMSNNIGHADQPSFNILTNTLLKDKCQWVDYNDSWALQIGAIIDNINDISYLKDGIVYSAKTNIPYCLVHQYDRVSEYKNYFDNEI